MSKPFPPSIALLGAVFLMAGCSSDAEEGSQNTAEPAENSPATAEDPPAPAEDPPATAENPPATAEETPMPSDDPAIAAIKDFIESQGVNTSSAGWRTRLRVPPKQTFTSGKTYYWTLMTSEGDMKLKFMPDVAPMHVTNAIYLTELGYYDSLTFHRVIPGFMAQGGCPLGNGRGDPGYKIDFELDPQVGHSAAGVLSTANSGPNTDGSQFFIMFGPSPRLDGGYTVYGQLVEGMDTLRKLEAAGSGSGRTTKPLTIVTATITVE